MHYKSKNRFRNASFNRELNVYWFLKYNLNPSRYDVINNLYKTAWVHNINLRFFSRFHYPSQNITLQHVVNTSFALVVGIAVDSANDHVYWVTDVGNTLSRCKSDGSNLVVFNCFSGTVTIRLDVKNRYNILTYFYIFLRISL